MRPARVTDRKLTVAIEAIEAVQAGIDYEDLIPAAERKRLDSALTVLQARLGKVNSSPSRSTEKPKSKPKPKSKRATAAGSSSEPKTTGRRRRRKTTASA